MTKVRQTGNFINPSNRAFTVEIPIPNEKGNIKPNLGNLEGSSEKVKSDERVIEAYLGRGLKKRKPKGLQRRNIR